MNLGVENSRGDILVFCHADSLLPKGWREAVIEKLVAWGKRRDLPALDPPCKRNSEAAKPDKLSCQLAVYVW